MKNFDGLKDVFKLIVDKMLENGLESDDELSYTNLYNKSWHSNLKDFMI